jgi:hypothetical protein
LDRRNEHSVCVFEASAGNPINPNDERSVSPAKRGARLLGRTNEVTNCKTSGFGNLIAQPAHAARVLDPVRLREAEIGIDFSTNFIGVEVDGI